MQYKYNTKWYIYIYECFSCIYFEKNSFDSYQQWNIRGAGPSLDTFRLREFRETDTKLKFTLHFIEKQEMFQKHICLPWCKIQVYLLCRGKTCPKQVSKGLKYIKWTNTLGSKECLWTCDLKINRDPLLIEGNPCTKFGIDQVKGSKDIERTT